MRLIYAVTCCILLGVLLIAGVRLDRLEQGLLAVEEANASLLSLMLDRAQSWEEERSQWQEAVESRNAVIVWWEAQPPQTITEEVEVIRVIPVEVVTYQELRDFTSLAELRDFLASDDTDTHIYLTADENGEIILTGMCEDYAFQLRDRAQAKGIRLDTEILSRAEAIKWQQYMPGDAWRLGANDGHYLNKAVIGNEVWYIEPQNDKIWLAYYLD